MKRFTTVDEYIKNLEQWKPEITKLREVLLSTELDETTKWGAPCYTFSGKNVAGIGGFKSYFGIWFFQGALLKDQSKLLINAQEGKTKALRQWRMQSSEDIKPRIIKSYLKEAIGLVEQGKEIKPNRSKPVVIPAELSKAFRKHKKAHACFNSFTIGKQREYTVYIADAKRDETKQKRIEKILPMILDGIGLNDKYRC